MNDKAGIQVRAGAGMDVAHMSTAWDQALHVNYDLRNRTPGVRYQVR